MGKTQVYKIEHRLGEEVMVNALCLYLSFLKPLAKSSFVYWLRRQLELYGTESFYLFEYEIAYLDQAKKLYNKWFFAIDISDML